MAGGLSEAGQQLVLGPDHTTALELGEGAGADFGASGVDATVNTELGGHLVTVKFGEAAHLFAVDQHH